MQPATAGAHHSEGVQIDPIGGVIKEKDLYPILLFIQQGSENQGERLHLWFCNDDDADSRDFGKHTGHPLGALYPIQGI